MVMSHEMVCALENQVTKQTSQVPSEVTCWDGRRVLQTKAGSQGEPREGLRWLFTCFIASMSWLLVQQEVWFRASHPHKKLLTSLLKNSNLHLVHGQFNMSSSSNQVILYQLFWVWIRPKTHSQPCQEVRKIISVPYPLLSSTITPNILVWEHSDWIAWSASFPSVPYYADYLFVVLSRKHPSTQVTKLPWNSCWIDTSSPWKWMRRGCLLWRSVQKERALEIDGFCIFLLCFG